jgi:hypothetical protein
MWHVLFPAEEDNRREIQELLRKYLVVGVYYVLSLHEESNKNCFINKT